MEKSIQKIKLKNEILRKGIHLFSSIIPTIYLFTDKGFILIIVITGVAFMVLLDIFKKYNPVVRKLYIRFLKPVLRTDEMSPERKMFTGGTLLTLSSLLTILIFSKPVAILSLYVLTVCDSFSAIAGKSIGKHKFINDKTLEGTLAFILSGVVIVLIMPLKVTSNIYEYIIGIICVILSSGLELINVKIDDNITIPLFFGITYTLFCKIFI